MPDIEAQILGLLRKLLIQTGRTSWRPEGFARKHSLSPSFIYGEIRARRLRARKPADGVTIITDQDEAEWLDAMPTIGAAKSADSITDCENSSNNSEAVE